MRSDVRQETDPWGERGTPGEKDESSRRRADNHSRHRTAGSRARSQAGSRAGSRSRISIGIGNFDCAAEKVPCRAADVAAGENFDEDLDCCGARGGEISRRGQLYGNLYGNGRLATCGVFASCQRGTVGAPVAGLGTATSTLF